MGLAIVIVQKLTIASIAPALHKEQMDRLV